MSMHTIDLATFSGVHVNWPLAAAPHSTPAQVQEWLSQHTYPSVALLLHSYAIGACNSANNEPHPI